MFLSLPDPAPRLAAKPGLFSIRLANKGTWDSTTGLNSLQRTVTVKPQVAAPLGQAVRAGASCTSRDGPGG
jgi:hypothetical protein